MSNMVERIEKIKAWREATSAGQGKAFSLGADEAYRRRAERALVLARSGSSMNSINVAICKGRMSDGQFGRLVEASQGTSHPIAAD